MVVRMLAIPSASTPVTLRLRASATGFRRVSSIAVWFSSSFRTIGMSTGQPRSSFATSSYAKLCNKVIREPTNMTGDVDGKHEVKGEISPIQSISECKDLKKPSQEVSQAVDEVGFEKDLVCLKDGDRLMKLTIAELRGLMRKLGIPPTGRKQDLIQALKSFSRNKSADQSSENSIPKGSESFLSKITPDQPRNQGRRGQIKPVSVKFGLGIQDHDGEGRLITIEFDRFYLVAGYVPNSGQKLERLTYRVQQWDPALSSYIKDLEQKKPVVLTGDLNCAHEEIDIYNPDGNHRSAGFTVEERKSFEDNYLNQGFVDSFRHKYPNTVGYTYWGYRQGARAYNRGWRLDYFLVSNAIVNNVYDSYILPDVNGSDHCPIGLILNL